MPANAASRPWRSFLRFSVRCLIVLVLVVGGWLAWLVRHAHVQREAVAAIVKGGNTVEYDWQWSNGRFNPGGEPWAPRWLVELAGVDYFGNVVSAVVINASEHKLIHLGKLGKLRNLVITVESDTADAWLVHLNGLTNLLELNLGGAHVTDAGLAHLAGLTNLSGLGLDCPRVSDAGLASLKGLPKLSVLDVEGTQVTEAGIRQLQQALPRLRIHH
jgi:hypothetical protein